MPGPLFWFFALVGAVTLATAIRFAFRPAERILAVLRALSAATTFSALAAFLAGVTNGLYGVVRWLERNADAAGPSAAWRTALGGFAESPIVLVLAFAVLAVTWLLVAVGLRRHV